MLICDSYWIVWHNFFIRYFMCLFLNLTFLSFHNKYKLKNIRKHFDWAAELHLKSVGAWTQYHIHIRGERSWKGECKAGSCTGIFSKLRLYHFLQLEFRDCVSVSRFQPPFSLPFKEECAFTVNFVCFCKSQEKLIVHFWHRLLRAVASFYLLVIKCISDIKFNLKLMILYLY